MEDFIQLYHPDNLKNLSAEQKAGLQNLTPQQIHALAEAYPNIRFNTNYLVMKDTNITDDRKQLYPVTSWQNLSNLIKLGQTNMVAVGMREGFERPTTAQAAKTGKAQDLTADDLKNEKGLKKTAQTGKAQTISGKENTNEFPDLSADAQAHAKGKTAKPKTDKPKKASGK